MSATSYCTIDALEARRLMSASASISGVIYNDANGDYIRGQAEVGISGKRVYIDANLNGAFDEGERNTYCGEDGSYVFANLSAGQYDIRVELEAGLRRTVPVGGKITVNLGNGQQCTGRDFGITARSLVSGLIYNDSNNNGKWDNGETGLAGVRVHLDVNNNGQYDSGENFVLSNAAGMYFLNTPIGGTVKVRIESPTERVCTQSNAATRSISLSAGLNAFGRNCGMGYDFNDGNGEEGGGGGNQNNGSISGHVTASLLSLLGLVGLENRTVFIDANDNDILDLGELSCLTDADGFYEFKNLVAGVYNIKHVAANEIVHAIPQAGGYVVNLLANQNRPNCDFSLSALFDVLLDPDDSILEANALGAVGAGLNILGHTVRGADVDVFAFTVQAGATLDFIKDCYGDLESVKLRICNSLGITLASDINLNGEVLTHTFAQAGTYYVAVSSRGNVNSNLLTGLLDSLGFGGSVTGEYSLEIKPHA